MMLWMGSCGGGTATRGAQETTFSGDRELATVSEAFYAGYLEHEPNSAAGLGYHQYDGRVPDVSEAALQARIAFYRRYRDAFETIDDASLSPRARVELAVLEASVRGELFALEDLRGPWRNPMSYSGGLSLLNYVSRDYKPVTERAQSIIQIADQARAYVTQADANLVQEIPRTWLDTALLQVNGMISFAREDVVPALDGLAAEARVPLEAALERLALALEWFKARLEARRPHVNDAYALGPELFLKMLADTQSVAMSLDTLEAVGRADLERNLLAIREAARLADPNRSVEQIVAEVAADRPIPADVFGVADRQVTETRRFVVEHDIASIPADEVALVRPSPAFMRWNSAFLDTPGPFETQPLPSFYYISPPDPAWPEQQQREYMPGTADLLFTSVHEVWPGHFLHYLHIDRNESIVLRSFGNYAMTEGWAHYAEQMMFDEGLGNQDPRVHVGQLLNALLRNVRYLSAIGLHARSMTVEESQRAFREQAFQDEATARQQAVRGTFDPMYLSYTLGKLMIAQLRDDMRARDGAAFSLGRFHDAFLSYGSAPIPVIRTAMLGPNAGPALR